MSARTYGPHDPSTAPTHVTVGANSNEHPEAIHPALIRQREQVNAIAAGKASSLAAVNAAAPVDVPFGAITPEEWATFTQAVRSVAVDGIVRGNDVRPLVRGRIFHKHIGACYTRTESCGLLVRLRGEKSADVEGRNGHHPSGVFRLVAAA